MFGSWENLQSRLRSLEYKADEQPTIRLMRGRHPGWSYVAAHDLELRELGKIGTVKPFAKDLLYAARQQGVLGVQLLPARSFIDGLYIDLRAAAQSQPLVGKAQLLELLGYATLIGGSPQDYNRFWANVCTGQVNWNRASHDMGASAPFGGVGLSGNHRPGSFYMADHCAYPVASAEMEQPRALVGVGFKDAE